MSRAATSPETGRLDLDELADWLVERRWFGSKTRGPAEVAVLDMPTIDAGPPELLIALVEVTFGDGGSEIYQVPLAIDSGERASAETRRGDELVRTEARVASFGDGIAYDLLAERRDPPRLLELIAAGGEASSDEGRVIFAWPGTTEPPAAGVEARPISAEQSNSSVIFGDEAILKIYRRVEDGVNPELEMLRFLNLHGFDAAPELLGWYRYEGAAADATLAVVQEFVADGRDGWEWALDGLAADPDSLLEPLHALGAVVGSMHTALASDASDPAFAPEQRGEESLVPIVAALDAEIERAFGDMPDDERLAPIAGRGEDLRARLHGLATIGGLGMAIRSHEDLHLGQTLLSDGGWTILDFEGEPARPLAERRAKHSPLRDVAGMLRSIAYAPLAARLLRGATPPEGWELSARERFLVGYIDAVDPALLPPSRAEVDQLLAIYELEKAVYELDYERNNRPDWVEIPVAGIARLLGVEVGR
jgi:maltokinase